MNERECPQGHSLFYADKSTREIPIYTSPKSRHCKSTLPGLVSPGDRFRL